MKRIPTGIKELDKMIQGGFPEKSAILIAGGPGTGKTVFAAQFIYSGATKYKEKGVFVTFEETAESFKNNMLTLGWNFDALQKNHQVEILDLLSLKESDKMEIALNDVIEAVRAMEARRLVIDSITALTVAFKEMAEVRVLISVLQKILRTVGCTTVLTTEIPWGSNRLGAGIEEFLCDGIILLEMIPRKNLLRRRLIVLKMRGTELDLKYYQYNISKNGIEILPYPEVEE
ncbi:MAG: ATPase domain-containing protein [Candidatus Bathyarchaeia archaeon]